MQIDAKSLDAALVAVSDDVLVARRCPKCGHIKIDPQYLSCEGPHAGPFTTNRSHAYELTEEMPLLPTDKLGDAVSEYLDSEGVKVELERCGSCHGSGEFDHGAGEGRVDHCIPMDPNNHRYCPCIDCDGTGSTGYQRLIGPLRETPLAQTPKPEAPGQVFF